MTIRIIRTDGREVVRELADAATAVRVAEFVGTLPHVAAVVVGE